ncbi:MAG: CBS domain-containing protein [Bacilli bacterium]
MNVNDIMTKDLIIGKYNDSIKNISELMLKYDIGFIPISKDNKIIGVVTDRDIVVRALIACAKCSSKIESYISSNIISCDALDTTEYALNCMKKNKVKRLIVTNQKKIVGIVSISDLIENKKSIETIKFIYKIDKNDSIYSTEIDEFYL